MLYCSTADFMPCRDQAKQKEALLLGSDILSTKADYVSNCKESRLF